MYWFSSNRFFPLLTVMKIIADVIIPSIHCDICQNANVTIDINLIQLPPICDQVDRSITDCCLQRDAEFTTTLNPLRFIRNGRKTTLKLATKHQYWIHGYLKRPNALYMLLININIKFQLANDTDGITAVIAEWSNRPEVWKLQPIQIKIEQNTNYPFSVPRSNYSCKQEPNFIYNITVENDCPDKDSTIPKTPTPPPMTLPNNTQKTTTTKGRENKERSHKNEKPKKKIDPRLINSLAVSGSSVVITTIICLIMYFGWYKRTLNKLKPPRPNNQIANQN